MHESEYRKSPFDQISWERVSLHCSKCKHNIFTNHEATILFRYDAGDEYLHEGLDLVIKRRISVHVCAQPDVFKLGEWVINTCSGHLWQLAADDVATVNEGYRNGKRNIVHYL